MTGLKAEYTRISTSKFVATAITEFEAGKLMADVVQAPLPVLELLKEKGVLAAYRSPSAAGYPDWTRHDDRIQLFGIEYVALIYNKERVKKPDSGEISIGGELVWSKDKGISVQPEKRGLGMVFQTYAIWPHMNVFDNVGYPLQVRGVAKDVVRRKVADTLRFVQLEGYEKRPATKLSGGQQQRVALARALVAEPKVILFDEPLSNLDAKLREETRKELRAFLGKLKITAVYVTHDRVEALALSDAIAVMRAGQIVEIGTPQKIYFDADHRFVADFIGRANLVKARLLSHEGGFSTVESGLGPIVCQQRAIPLGSEATLCIRPEFIRIVAGAAPAARNLVNGRIDSLVFVGEAYEVEIRVGSELLLAKIDPDLKLREGDAVSFTLDPAHCLLVAI